MVNGKWRKVDYIPLTISGQVFYEKLLAVEVVIETENQWVIVSIEKYPLI